ncbi:hypothetical protein [Mycobacteroides salmoniphilum]|uniref:Uncharacterized protein n=1 Tax=Mycobacteroides salmoniphilum TaxID=404941 RepID=A0A4R8T0A2_9MYCO|nr:hypothetical protein [Mycobacteroides salmoniphilum]TEA09186.1 hypothetical protein CCUG60884_00176 [Mycobacteroides salmoniphilum]
MATIARREQEKQPRWGVVSPALMQPVGLEGADPMYQHVSLVRRGDRDVSEQGDAVIGGGGRDQQLLQAFTSSAEAAVMLLDDCKHRSPDPRVRFHPELPEWQFTAAERARVHAAWVTATAAGGWEVTRAIKAAARGQMKAGAQVLEWLGESELASRARLTD